MVIKVTRYIQSGARRKVQHSTAVPAQAALVRGVFCLGKHFLHSTFKFKDLRGRSNAEALFIA